MTPLTARIRGLFAGLAALLLFTSAADAAEVRVMTSPVAKDELVKSGLDPIPPGATN
jgi:hypothetical protein